ncbi:MAG TPA: glycerophosphodiester phosphodiesterase family protein [Geminicoccaceae bacterium]|nr:glycerophosphodiester phosphodiesterase family protein [Geminicoccaceae bacterium]
MSGSWAAPARHSGGAAVPRLKWHQLRRRANDPVFQRANLEAGLTTGAAVEVDLVATADGHLVCLHDLTLDRETTGSGPVRARTRAAIEQLRQRANDGAPLAEPPLFLDEVVAACRRHGVRSGARVQLDMKEPDAGLDAALLRRFGAVLGEMAPAFVAGGCEWAPIVRLAAAAPGLAKGFDPLDWHRADPPRDAAAFEALAARVLAEAPDAVIYYLHADLVLAGLAAGVNLVERLSRRGAEIDAWTVDPDRPNLRADLAALIEAGCHQITTNNPDALTPIIREIAE